MLKKFVLAIGLMLTFGQGHSAVMWDWDAATNTLFGAQNVDVGGTLYNVGFVEGSCIGLFSGCDEAGDFDFADIGGAAIASQALLDQVFIDDGGSPALFDSIPTLVNGCESISIFSGCIITTPTINVPFGNFVIALNSSDIEGRDGTGQAGLVSALDIDSATNAGILYAKWTTVSAVSVPEPPVILLFVTGILGLFFARRKIRK